jgi:hypothetical protein
MLIKKISLAMCNRSIVTMCASFEEQTTNWESCKMALHRLGAQNAPNQTP